MRMVSDNDPAQAREVECSTKVEKRCSVASQSSNLSVEFAREAISNFSPTPRPIFERRVSEQTDSNRRIKDTIGELHRRWLDSEYGDGQTRRREMLRRCQLATMPLTLNGADRKSFVQIYSEAKARSEENVKAESAPWTVNHGSIQQPLEDSDSRLKGEC